LNFLVG